jgi:hypothetical protein
MGIYKLYVKTHSKTGLKYLGMTTQEDHSKYTGSGLHWLRHLRVHGFEHITEVIEECETLESLRERGLYYSNLWNVVKDPAWANMILESGQGVIPTEEIIKKRSNTRKTNTANGSIQNWTNASTEKYNKTRIENGTNIRTQSSIEKQLNTRVARGTDPKSPAVIDKCRETKKLNGTISNFVSNNPSSIKKSCPHCNENVGSGLFTRWHGDNCKKLKEILELSCTEPQSSNQSVAAIL